MFNTDAYLPVFIESLETSSGDVNTALSKLKDEGATAISAVLVLKRHMGLSTSSADSIVLKSQLWDTNGAIKLRKDLITLLEEE